MIREAFVDIGQRLYLNGKLVTAISSDDTATRSPDKLITEQAIKDYVDSVAGGGSTGPWIDHTTDIEYSAGNVLIGTSVDTGYKLNVAGSILGSDFYTTGKYYLNTASTAWINHSSSNLFIENTVGDVKVKTHYANKVTFGSYEYTTSVDTISINGGNNISIGDNFAIGRNIPLGYSAAGSLYIQTDQGSPFPVRFVLGDGSGWQMTIAKRSAYVTTDVIYFSDSGQLYTLNEIHSNTWLGANNLAGSTAPNSGCKMLMANSAGTILSIANGANGSALKMSSAGVIEWGYQTEWTPTVTATANNQTLVGFHANPTFVDGAYTGIYHVSAQFESNVIINQGQINWGTTSGSKNHLLFYDGGVSGNRHGIGYRGGIGMVLFTYNGNKIVFGNNDAESILAPGANFFDTATGFWNVGGIHAINNITLYGSILVEPSALGKDIHMNGNDGNQLLFYDGGSAATRMGISFTQSVGLEIFAGYTNPILFGMNKDQSTLTLNNSEMKLTADGRLVIGPNGGHADAILDLVSTTKAFSPPKMTTTQKNTLSTASFMVYDTTLNQLSYHNGTTWINL